MKYCDPLMNTAKTCGVRCECVGRVGCLKAAVHRHDPIKFAIRLDRVQKSVGNALERSPSIWTSWDCFQSDPVGPVCAAQSQSIGDYSMLFYLMPIVSTGHRSPARSISFNWNVSTSENFADCSWLQRKPTRFSVELGRVSVRPA